MLLNLQWKKRDWAKTIISYGTNIASRLPFVDVAINDFNQKEETKHPQKFRVEIGSVCFK